MKKLNRNEWVAVAAGIGMVVFMLFGNVVMNIFRPVNANNNGMELPQTGVRAIDFATGEGVEVATGDTVVVHYVGRLPDGKVFDSSVDTNTPFQFIVGRGDVIRGWDEGLLGMKAGGQRRLIIAPDYAYGNRSIGAVPANSTLIFDIQVLEVKKAQ